ncbi:hypothetical protein [Gordonia phthalatica]|uniref:Uncharacterized protein n=1 Tax=Gordonia phthalatica TaxID=1136941 RepID=A0A0N9NF47_9ACTN|nr:hypothetical protein [Gordonia phthalatica]ALG86310.1 hypothetical protein ACH46_19745 [Gordonia phthalatica]
MAKATTPAKTATKSTVAPETQITDFLSSVVDSTRTLVDGLLESAGDVERTVREHADDAIEKLTPSSDDIEALRKHVKNLAEQVEKLANLRVSTDKADDSAE